MGLFRKKHIYMVSIKVEDRHEVNYLWTRKFRSDLGLKDFKLKIKKRWPKADNIRVEVIR